MNPWRWLLFVAMARFELAEDTYLRIPAGRTLRSDPPARDLWQAARRRNVEGEA